MSRNDKQNMLISTRELRHHYPHGSGKIEVLHGVDMDVYHGEFIAVMDASGSGKSTLLHILGCLLRPSSGSYFLNNRDILQLKEKELARLRANTVAHVFQNFHLLPAMTVMENVLLPSLYNGIAPEQAGENARRAIAQVGLDKRMMHKPAELSGGEMQRVTIARALAMQPELILADEPTGNLDHSSTLEVLSLFQEINKQGCTVIMVTHDRDVAKLARSTRYMIDGYLE